MASNNPDSNQPQPRASVPNRYASLINEIGRACDFVREEAFYVLKNEIWDVYELVQSNPERDSEAFDDLVGRVRDLTEVITTTEEKFSSVFYVEKRLKARLDDAFDILFPDFERGLQVDTDNENMASNQTLIDDVKHTDNVSNKKQVTALVVDDNVLALSFYCKQLTNLGVTTRGVENGKHAVELCHSGERFDFILMDYEMPVMNGAEATRALRKMGVTSLILGMTALSRESESTEFKDAGIDRLQEKPLRKHVIESLLKDLTEK